MLAELFALISLAAPICAGEEELHFPDEKIVVHVDSPWPKMLKKGWLPLFVRIENNDDHAQRVVLHAESWGVTRKISATVDVGANQSSSVELLFPVFSGISNRVNLSAAVGGTRKGFSSSLGAEEPAGLNARAVLVLDSELRPAGTAEVWSSEVSNEVAQTPVPEEYRRFGLTISPSTPSGTIPNNILVQTALFRQMPARSEAYSSLDVVVLDVAHGLPEAQRLSPLIAWAKLGGSLLVVGPRAEQIARSVPELSGWMEDRFDSTGVCKGWQLGLGSLSIDEDPALANERQREFLRSPVIPLRGMVEDASGSMMHDSPPIIPDLFSLPLKAFSLFLILFAILIGPVNFVLVKRTKRPAILLITIPAIALAAALLLFVFGVTSQGLGVKIATKTLVVLDQREHRASSAEVRMIFAGLSPGAGLMPGSGSSCYAISTYQPDGHSGGQFEPIQDSQRAFQVDQTEGLVLSGQFIPSRTAFLQQILSEHAERGRIAIKRNGDKLSIENGLGTTVRSLVLRDAAGSYHRLSGELSNGASAELEPLDTDGGLGSVIELRGELPQFGPDPFPPACYMARLERNPFGDDCGVSGKEVEGDHRVFGVLALDSEEWR